MKKTYLALLALFSAALLTAQSDSTLYGIYRNASTQAMMLGKLEPSSGELTVISDSTVSTTYVLNSISAIDPFELIYYYVSVGRLKGIDLNSGQVAVDQELVLPDNYQISFMQFDVADSAIYCLTQTANAMPMDVQFRLAVLDPITGVVSHLGGIDTGLHTLLSLTAMATIDPISRRFYTVSILGVLHAFDMSDGSIVLSEDMNLEPEEAINFLRYNYADSTLYALKRNAENNGVHLCTIDPTDGSVVPRTLSNFGSLWLVANGMGTIDPNNGIFYFRGMLTEGLYQEKLFGLDLQSGELVVENTLSGLNGNFFDMMVYFPDICPPVFLFALNTDTGAPDEFALYPNPAHSSFTLTHPETAHGAGYQLVNLMGQVVQSGTLSTNSKAINIDSLPAGVYIVLVASGQLKMSKRLVVY